MIEYLQSFLIGSSILITFVYLTTVSGYQQSGIIRYQYYNYSILAPIYFGTMAVIAKYIYLHTKLSLYQSLFMISILSIIGVTSYITITRAYRFQTQSQWNRQYGKVLISHLVTYNIIIYQLEKCLNAGS
jgi:hypothetical protein